MSKIKSSIISGFLWTGIQTVGSKLISLVAQLILAWLLLPEDFGKISIAFSITSIIIVIQNFGLTDVLVSRGKMFYHIYNLAKSISSVVAFIAITLAVIFSFIVGYIYADNDITNLILIFSLSIPFNTLSVVPDSKLRIDLKFKELSTIKFFEFFISQGLIIVFVLLGYGIYSFVFGPLISSVLRYFWLSKEANCSHRFKFTLNHYLYLFGNSIYGFFHSIFQTIIRHSDYLILALFVSQTDVGIYFMAYSLSVQAVGLLVNSLSPILFPALMKIPKNETEKIKIILLKVTGIYALFGMPFALWQASIADSLISIFFNNKWTDTILLVQILSFGIGFTVASSLWAPALRIKSKYKTQAFYSLLSLLFFISLIVPFSYSGGKEGLALSVTIYLIISGPILLFYSFRYYDISFSELFHPLLKYFSLSIMIFGTCYFFTHQFNLNDMIKLLINGVMSPVIYFGILFLVDKDFCVFLKEIKIIKK